MSAPLRSPIRAILPLIAAGLIGTLVIPSPTASAPALGPSRGLWLDATELASLPTEGPAWEQLLDDASGPLGAGDIADQDSTHDSRTFAAALVAARTGDETMRTKVNDAIESAIGTEDGGRTLALARNLLPYVLAADLIDLSSHDPALDADFRSWLDQVRDERLAGRTLISTHEDRPNNWGTHAGASRIAVALYLGDEADLARAIEVFRGFLGDRSAYNGFEFGSLSWQSDPSRPTGINPAGATIDGHNVDGVIPDDQRRGGGFEWPPPCENYVREGLQGIVAQAELLTRQGHAAWSWSDEAIRRAARWVTDEGGCDLESDDAWMAPVLNRAYGTNHSWDTGLGYGKHVGYTDWTHGQARVDADQCTIVGTAGPDLLVGTGGDDVICGLGGNDVLIAKGGADVIAGGAGDDEIWGGTGRDVILAGAGDDTVRGGPDDDLISGGPGDDDLAGNVGRDVVAGDDGDDVIDGGRHDDMVFGAGGADRLRGGDGADTLWGGPGPDLLDGGPAPDLIHGGSGDDECVADRQDQTAGC